jgi:hypothetical protein
VGKNFAVLDIFSWDIYREPPSTICFQILTLVVCDFKMGKGERGGV